MLGGPERYVGEYRIDYGYEPGDKMVIWLDDGTLMGQLEPLPAVRIFFESKAEMFNLVRPDTVRVGFNENGIAMHLTVVEDGKAVIGATRIPAAGAKKATRSRTAHRP